MQLAMDACPQQKRDVVEHRHPTARGLRLTAFMHASHTATSLRSYRHLLRTLLVLDGLTLEYRVRDALHRGHPCRQPVYRYGYCKTNRTWMEASRTFFLEHLLVSCIWLVARKHLFGWTCLRHDMLSATATNATFKTIVRHSFPRGL